jgi:15-cis-phytoene desaturase
MQRYLASMEGAILSGKLTAQAINNSQRYADSAQPPEAKEKLEIANLLPTPESQQPVLRAES